MGDKKLSFGFKKIIKHPVLRAGPVANGNSNSKHDGDTKIEFISGIEGQRIEVEGIADSQDDQLPLVIPLRATDKNTILDRLAKLQSIKEAKHVDHAEDSLPTAVAANEIEETLEQKAVRELVEDSKEHKERSEGTSNIVVPLKPEDLPLEGAIESTLDDYDAIPIERFGLAMLRGMGWKEEPNVAPRDSKLPEGPAMRPKGLGLGAECTPKDKQAHLIAPEKNEVLAMQVGAMVKVLLGKHADAYGKVMAFDECGRVLIKFALGGNTEYINENLIGLVSKAEYDQYSKVLNATKYEQYKNQQERKHSPADKSDRCSPQPYRDRRSRRDEYHRTEHHHNSSSDDSDRDRRRSHPYKPSRTSSGTKKKSHKPKHQRRDYSRDRAPPSSEEEDLTHKQKKTKKSRRQRSRSR